MNTLNPDTGKLQIYLRLCLPHMVTFIFILLNLSSPALPVAQFLKPDFVLMAVYYWAIYRPTIMPPAFIFCLGVIVDLLGGTPVGLYALTYLAAHWVTRDQRRFLMGQPFVTLWLGFMFISFAAFLIQWGFYLLSELTVPLIMPAIFRMFATIFIFPGVVMLLLNIHKLLPAPPSRTFSY
jgi:rod shape-determining protein MreD